MGIEVPKDTPDFREMARKKVEEAPEYSETVLNVAREMGEMYSRNLRYPWMTVFMTFDMPDPELRAMALDNAKEQVGLILKDFERRCEAVLKVKENDPIKRIEAFGRDGSGVKNLKCIELEYHYERSHTELMTTLHEQGKL